VLTDSDVFTPKLSNSGAGQDAMVLSQERLKSSFPSFISSGGGAFLKNLGSNFPELGIAEDTRQDTAISYKCGGNTAVTLSWGPAEEPAFLNFFFFFWVILVTHAIIDLPYTQGVSSHFS